MSKLSDEVTAKYHKELEKIKPLKKKKKEKDEMPHKDMPPKNMQKTMKKHMGE